jgi:Glycosyl transferase family 90
VDHPAREGHKRSWTAGPSIDIDGNSNAWSNFFTRLVMGCCVLKVASAAGFRQWYYGDIEPWTHYVPVKADLSDLHDIVDWCRANPTECRRIAARGQAFAMARDFDTEVVSARERVDQAYAGGQLTPHNGSWQRTDMGSRLGRVALERVGHGD